VRCNSGCVCTACHNDGLHEAERLMAVRAIRRNYKGAFKGTGLAVDEQIGTTANGSTKTANGSTNGSTKTVRGCRCKQSKCLKKYCECFGLGLKCGENCICEDCMNGNDLRGHSLLFQNASIRHQNNMAGAGGSSSTHTAHDSGVSICTFVLVKH
jgi:hypothetical protein